MTSHAQSSLTWVEVSTQAINHNIAVFRKTIGAKRLLMPVIKSNAYGHGILDVAKICEKNKQVDRLCIVSLDEALVLIQHKIKKPLIILGIYDLVPEKLATAIRNKVTFPLYTLEQAAQLQAASKQAHQNALVHIKVDTGTSRIGIAPHEALAFIKHIKQRFPNIQIEGMWSHYASSESDALYTARQTNIFKKTVAHCEAAGISIPLKHISCSAATLMKVTDFGNAVRFGISLYGLSSTPNSFNHPALKPALSWYTTIIQVKNLPAGTKISYGGSYTTTKPTKLAVLPIGYADGYVRAYSNNAYVMLRGKKCPVRGRVCMNLTMIDVSSVPHVKAGDIVTVLGKDITADELARISNTINYEVVTRINPTIKRLNID